MGSYICISITLRLRAFFQSDGKPCEQDNGGCSHTCTEVGGGYECSCPDGYELDQWGHTCTDVNECNNWPCQQNCVNTDGGYQCSCDDGFQLGEDGQTCTVRNSCSDGSNGGCDHVCKQLYGSRLCDCHQGYWLSPDGFTCEDINECLQYGPCSQACNNTLGGFHCSCFAGYQENGTDICIDIDECADRTICGTSAPSTCLNTQGSYKCIYMDMDFGLANDDESAIGHDLQGDEIGTTSALTSPPAPKSKAMAATTELIIIGCVMGAVILFLIVVSAAGFMMLFRRMNGRRRNTDSRSQLIHRPRYGDNESLPRGASSIGEQRSYIFNP